jgi:acyl carrier protein
VTLAKEEPAESLPERLMSQDANPTDQDAATSLRDNLIDFLTTLEIDLGGELSDETALVGSGLLDSLALVRLATWIEGEVGHPLDPDKFDLQEEWKTVGKVVAYIQKNRNPS